MKNNFKLITDSEMIISKLMLPSYSNFSGKIHGGYILSLLDEVAFACASKHSGSYCVTASVDTVNFLNPIEIGELVTMKASINYVGRSSMIIGIRVISENIQTGQVKHCNSSYFTMVAKNDKGENQEVPGIVINSTKQIQRFFKSLRQIQQRKERSIDLNNENYLDSETLDILKDYKVKVKIND